MTVLDGKVRQLSQLPSRACDGCGKVKPLVGFPMANLGVRKTLCFVCTGFRRPWCDTLGHELVEERPGWHECLRCQRTFRSSLVVEVFRAVALGEIA